jgi:ribosomal protein S18 acetylase RimI-like enzyme
MAYDDAIVLAFVDGAGRMTGMGSVLTERWAREGGAQWMRLGVVESNAKACRFWDKMGFVQVRMRDLPMPGGATQPVRVMVKPLSGRGIEDYLSRVERDRPETPA